MLIVPVHLWRRRGPRPRRKLSSGHLPRSSRPGRDDARRANDFISEAVRQLRLQPETAGVTIADRPRRSIHRRSILSVSAAAVASLTRSRFAPGVTRR
jgi:hypothetical protein